MTASGCQVGGAGRGGPGRSAPWLLAALVLLGLVGVTLGPWLCGREALYDGDLRYLQLPLRHVVQASLARGELPLWAPEVRGGFPLHAYGELGLFYPPNAALLRLPPRLGVPLTLVLHVLLGAVGLGVWIRSRGGSAAAWLVTASSFWLGGVVLAQLGWINAICAAAWWPWLLWALDRPGPLFSLQRVALASGFGALLLLAGRPQLAIPAALGAGLVAWTRVGDVRRGQGLGLGRPGVPGGPRASRPRAAAGLAGLLAAAGLLAVGLAGVQALPTYELLQRSDRTGGVPAAKAAAGLGTRLEAATACYLALPATTATGRGRGGQARAYPGVLALLLAAAALGTWPWRRGRGPFAFALLAAVGLVLATGWLEPLLRAVPVLRSLRTPARFLPLYALGVAGLAGIGVDRIAGSRWRWGLALLVATEMGLAARTQLPLGPAEPFDATPLAARTLLDLPQKTPDGVAARVYAPNARVLERHHLPADAGRQVPFVQTVEHLGSNLAAQYGLRDVSGYGDLAPRRYDALLLAGRVRVLRLLAVRYITLSAQAVSPPGLTAVAMLPDRATIYEVQGAGPRAFVVHDVQVERDEARSLGLVLDRRLDLSRQAVVDRAPPLPSVPSAAPAAFEGVRWLRDDPLRATMDAALARPGLLVIADAWGPGWEARVDGAPATIVRADHALRGIALPQGKHRVDLRYRPASLRRGIALSVACVALLAVAAVVVGLRHRIARRMGAEKAGEAAGGEAT